MIKQLAHICIHATDLEETSRFYTEILGLKKAFVFERNGEPFGYYIDFGNNTFVEVFKGSPGEVGNIQHVAVEVEDMDGLIDRIRSHGLEIGEKKLGADQTWQVWLTDPNGIRIEFMEYTEDSRQRVGGTCVAAW